MGIAGHYISNGLQRYANLPLGAEPLTLCIVTELWLTSSTVKHNYRI